MTARRAAGEDFLVATLARAWGDRIPPSGDGGFLSPARSTIWGWLKALAFNVLQAFKANLRDPFSKMQAGSLMRHFLLRPGSLHVTADELIVALDPSGSREVLTEYVEQLNANEHRIPWLGKNQESRLKLSEQGINLCNTTFTAQSTFQSAIHQTAG